MPYELISKNKKINEDKYLLSMKDLNIVSNLKEFIESGIDSLKIEGRMKSPEYIYYIVLLYRKLIDKYYKNEKLDITEKEIYELRSIFNRDFTKGFIFSEKNDNLINQKRPNHIGNVIGKVLSYEKGMLKVKLNKKLSINDGIRILDDHEDFGFIVTKMFLNNISVKEAEKAIIKIPCTRKVISGKEVLLTTDYNLMKTIKNKITIAERKVKLKCKCVLKINKEFTLSVTDGFTDITIKSDFKVLKAKKVPIPKERILKQLSKLGGTPYIFEELKLENDENIFLPVAKLNEIRREMVDILNKKRVYREKIIKKDYSIKVPNYEIKQKRNIFIQTIDQYQLIRDKNYNNIYAEEELYKKINDDPRVLLKLPRVVDNHENFNQKVLVCDLGSLNKYKNIESDFSFHVTNSYTASFLHNLGVKKITLSIELNEKQIEKIVLNYQNRYKAHPNLEVITFGKMEAMITKYDLLSGYNTNVAYIKDKFNNSYLIKKQKNINTIYNYKNVKIDDKKMFRLGINNVRHNIVLDGDLKNSLN